MILLEFLRPIADFARAIFPMFCVVMALVFGFDLWMRYFLAPRMGKQKKSKVSVKARRRSTLSTRKGR